MFEQCIKIPERRDPLPIGDAIYKKSQDNEIEHYRLRNLSEYKVTGIYLAGQIKTKNESAPLNIIHVKFSAEDLFLDNRKFPVSLNYFIGSLYRTFPNQCLFVFELEEQNKFKLCYIKLNHNALQKKNVYSDYHVSYWIHSDIQSKDVKNTLERLNEIFAKGEEMSSEEFYEKSEDIIKAISPEHSVDGITCGKDCSESSPLKYYFDLIFGVDEQIEVRNKIFDKLSKIYCYDQYKHCYIKVDKEDFWYALKTTEESNKILEKQGIESVCELQKNCEDKKEEKNASLSQINEEQAVAIVDNEEGKEIWEGEPGFEEKMKMFKERMEHFEFDEQEKEVTVKAIHSWYQKEYKLQNFGLLVIDSPLPVPTTWFEAVYLCNLRSRREGLSEFYKFSNFYFDCNDEIHFDVERQSQPIIKQGYKLISMIDLKTSPNNYNGRWLWCNDSKYSLISKDIFEGKYAKKCPPDTRNGFVKMVLESR